MLKSIGVILIYSAIAYFHIPQLIKDNMKRELWIFSILLLLITGISIAKIFKVNLPNPLDLISFILDPFLKILSV